MAAACTPAAPLSPSQKPTLAKGIHAHVLRRADEQPVLHNGRGVGGLYEPPQVRRHRAERRQRALLGGLALAPAAAGRGGGRGRRLGEERWEDGGWATRGSASVLLSARPPACPPSLPALATRRPPATHRASSLYSDTAPPSMERIGCCWRRCSLGGHSTPRLLRGGREAEGGGGPAGLWVLWTAGAWRRHQHGRLGAQPCARRTLGGPQGPRAAPTAGAPRVWSRSRPRCCRRWAAPGRSCRRLRGQ
jgi:hypothetical protein